MKKIIKKIICSAISIFIVFPIFPAKAEESITLTKAYTDRAYYQPGSIAQIISEIDFQGNSDSVTVHYQITSPYSLVLSQDENYSISSGTNKISFQWTTPAENRQGYLVKISIGDQEKFTAIDVSENVYQYPRYGYCVDFFPGESNETSIEMMRVLAQEYHINLVQYYDWMYRHEQILPADSESFIDMFNHTLSKNTITQRINAGHQYSQLAMAYQMSYMARENYQAHGVNPSWGLYSQPNQHNISYNPSDLQSLNSINQYFFPLEGKPAPLLMVMNPLNTDWQNFMANQYSQAVNTLDFDGIQIDQMGNFWGDVTYYSDSGDTVDLANSFSTFTNAIKTKLSENNPSKSIVTMNAVNGGNEDSFSSNDIICNANTDFSFSELWGNSDTYKKILDFVRWQRNNQSQSTMVLAAYMNQYDVLGSTYQFQNGQMTGVHSNEENGVTYVTGFDEVGDRVTLTVDVSESGNKALVFYAANGTDTTATKSLYLDGEKVLTVFFDPTRDGIIPAQPDWYKYSYEASYCSPKYLYMSAGTHTIELRQDADDTGGDIRIQTLTLGEYNDDSVRLTNAAIAASGAMHIELGTGMRSTSAGTNSDIAMLGNPYYPKAAKTMSSNLKSAIYNHYQFITAYESLLYDSDVVLSDSGWQNISINGKPLSGDAKPNTIWYVLKNKGSDTGIIHLINLISENDEDWRNATNPVTTQTNLSIKYYYPQYKTVDSVTLASEDLGLEPQLLNFSTGTDERGNYVQFSVPELQYWDMIYLKYSEDKNISILQAENGLLANVDTNTNHSGYYGTGFVDQYGEQYDSISFDFQTEEERDYQFTFRYSAAVDNEPVRHIYLDGNDAGYIHFPTTSDWETWAESFVTIHITPGLHRLVLYTEAADNGYINLDQMEVQ